MAKKNGSNYEIILYPLLQERGIPIPKHELKFHPVRKWRFDFAWEEFKIALEIEGMVWHNGRHNRGSGFVKDIEKYNAAALLGWRIIRTTPSDYCKKEFLDFLGEILNGR